MQKLFLTSQSLERKITAECLAPEQDISITSKDYGRGMLEALEYEVY